MRNKIILFFLLFFNFVISQSKDSLYIVIDEPIHIGSIEEGYEFIFNVKSSNPNFKFDTYFFKLYQTDIEKVALKKMSKIVNIENLQVIKQSDFFNGKTPCEIHEELSSRKVCLIKKMPNNQDSNNVKYQAWFPIYYGTSKDIMQTAKHKPKNGFLDGI